MSVYVSYVAKEQDSSGQSLESSRACHVVHCEDLDQANKMYNAFETAFNKNNRATLKVRWLICHTLPFIIILANGSYGTNGILCRKEQMGWHYQTATKGRAFLFIVNGL